MGFRMSLVWLIVFLSLLFVLSFLCGCSDEKSKSTPDASPDGDTDGDTDGDSDSDEDAGPDGGGTCLIDAQRMFTDVSMLASEEWGGRKPGTEGNLLAMQMVEDLFVETGFQPAGDSASYRQAFGYDAWEQIDVPELEVGVSAFEYGDDFAVMSYSGAGSVTSELVFAGYGITVPPFDSEDYPDCPLDPAGYDDFSGVEMDGKIALIMRHGPGDLESVTNNCPANEACDTSPCLWNFGYKTANAALHGAGAVIMVQHYSGGTTAPEGVSLGSEYYLEDLPVVFADRSVVETELSDLETWAEGIDDSLVPDPHATGIDATVDVTSGIYTVNTENVLAVMPGTDPSIGDQVVIVGAHIDHLGTDPITGDIFPGADDNASGTAVLMELARKFACEEIEPARTLVLASWNAEEVGLIGSCYYSENPTYPLDSTIAVYSVDMVGAGNATGVEVYGATEASMAWLSIVMSSSAEEMGYNYAVFPVDQFYASDHACFGQAGLPAVLISTLGPHSYYHTPMDTPENILDADLEGAARLMWAGVLPLVMGTENEYLTSKGADTTPEEAVGGSVDSLRSRIY